MSQWLPSQALTGMARPAPLLDEHVSRKEMVRFGYSIGALNFLVAERVLSELLRAPTIYPIPNVPAALRGYVNRQGALIPVWDLGGIVDCRIVENSSAPVKTQSSLHDMQQQSVLILGNGDNRVGVLIDGLPKTIRNIEKSARLPLLPAALTDHVRGAVFADHALWLELDHETFFSAQALRAAA
jgi:chemotaxis signal transduction protein